ncbi:uncharacterized protein LOC144927560 isoform X3 [Branchiostoma floridae x Branchiostoma belcheri]
MHGNIRGLTMGTTTEARPIPTRLLVWESTHPSVTAAAPIMTTTTGLTECGIRPAEVSTARRIVPANGTVPGRHATGRERGSERETGRETGTETDIRTNLLIQNDIGKRKGRGKEEGPAILRRRTQPITSPDRATAAPTTHRRSPRLPTGKMITTRGRKTLSIPSPALLVPVLQQLIQRLTERSKVIGRNTSVLRARNITTTVKRRCHNGRNHRAGRRAQKIAESRNTKTSLLPRKPPPLLQLPPPHPMEPIAEKLAAAAQLVLLAHLITSIPRTPPPVLPPSQPPTDTRTPPSLTIEQVRHKDTPKSHNRTGTPSSSQGTPSAHRGTPGQGSDRMDISTTPEHLQTIYTRSRTESPAVQNTPSPGTPSLGRSHTTPHSIPPSLVQQLFPPTSSASSISQVHNVGVEQSLQLLQHATMLTQQALQAQQQQPTTTVPPSNVSDSSPVSMRTSISDMSSPYQSQLSPQPSSSQQGEVVTSSASPAHSVHSQKSVGSHADGAVSSSYAVVHSSTPTAAHTVLPPSIELTPALVKYYKETLIRHTQGWQAEHAERQAQRLDEEGHAMGSLHSSQVSVDLKFARSLVRVSEIQATLQEQRILFLRQQIQHLEKMKNQNMFPS